ncbi:MAG: OadG family protein [Clostridia bacterium]|nr:OadG family protein [Clostridia bacterium]
MILEKNKTKLVYTSICIVLTVLIVLSLAISIMGNTKAEESAQAETKAAVTPSVLNLTEKGVAKDNFSSAIAGGQNEYIYFGSNVTNFGDTKHTGAIKWRVLSNSDTKYSNGNMLLWADYQLGVSMYNTHYNSPYYAFWGTSKLRAALNGGTYFSEVTTSAGIPTYNQSVKDTDSWLHKFFNDNERNSVVQTKEYETKLWGYESSHSSPKIYTTGIVGSGAGKYDKTIVNSDAGTYASEDGSSVTEKTKDYLFLLDYYDINNKAYGFGDNGTVYANKINSSWTKDSAGFPSNYDKTDTSTYLSFSSSADVDSYYWLRSPGRYASYSYCLLYKYDAADQN